jgi:uncharacterized protein (TIGR02996 family)
MSQAAFLRVIKADPDADVPRLVFADWLDEQGDTDRAEFIRLQVRGATLAGRTESTPPHVRLAKLYARHQADWLGPWREMGLEVLGPGGDTPSEAEQGWAPRLWWSRGLLQVRIGLTDLLAAPAAFLAQAWEWVEALTVTDPRSNAVAALAAQPWLTQLARLSVRTFRSTSLGDLGAQLLAQSPHLGNLADLRLPAQNLTATGIVALVESAWLPQVQRLICEFNQLDDTGGTALASVRWTRLRHLGLRRCGLTDTTAFALAQTSSLATLRRLELFGNHIGNLGALALGEAPAAQSLDLLDLSDNNINTATRAALRHNFGPRIKLI